eukprot:CAMPEP_0179423882 /NCGR_PEP_ID=MMETSP0799-20121207/11266_1 /TAXON_ID=46947 /ORGANISM="Geminigera cryophila, Strain CCMP2564" /LENGTH=109 /DNA_ID=CAMNT_0021198245 /DNA_START=24 /DNA_END=349 /DNA_ORIENTATION=-
MPHRHEVEGAETSTLSMDLVGFTKVATKTIKPIYTKILEMKFIEELLAGSLDRDIMARYLVQDSLYLKQYAKVLALIAAKSDDLRILSTMSLAAHRVCGPPPFPPSLSV